MINFAKIGIIISCIVFFSAINGFARGDHQQDMGNQGFSDMDGNRDGFISWPEMQTYQQDRFNDMDNDNDGLVSEAEYNSY